MKKQIYTFIGLIILLTISSATAAYAQSATTARAHIPFEFSVKNKTIAAGDYVINRQDDKGAVWSLRSRDNKQQTVLLVTNVESQRTLGSSKLTFRRYGDKYFLVGMETSAYKIGLRKSRAERTLEKSLKQNNNLAKANAKDAAPEIVTVEIAM